MSFGTTVPKPYNPNSDYEVPSPPSDSVSSLVFLNAGSGQDFLISGSWDNKVSIWQTSCTSPSAISAVPKLAYSHDAPVLCVAASKDGRVFSGSCDNTVKCCSLSQMSSTQQQVAKHDAPIKIVHYFDELNVLLTGGWDNKLMYWDTRQPNPVAAVPLSERVFASGANFPVVTIATADKQLITYDVRNYQTPYKTVLSPLKQNTRCVAVFNDKTGFAIGSIEGRVGVQYYEDNPQNSRNFAFKCHRPEKTNLVYAVNAISFHPYGTFSTAGADGNYCFWDKDSKQRLRTFKAANGPISATCFNSSGTLFAYSVCYDWSKGFDGSTQQIGTNIMLHHPADDEIKPRPKS